ncbi:hypothetical protein phytr_1150 [Candidatus Phycorickettsia trachydisci]|uniref:Uncharacterized protein n=1 Tax=Candidatus Phycorickettsia trachydisci TaxID=2115978 RepID=A0A2P1P747_9RICK|nr:ankyrin repeat domain-containing protein [Candidatus Phycorickettsia trachydisci]AVP87076.1 hypothetical protein phytr_1150 [Candidatus Phycorickettsia trachydisci]
MTTLIKSQPNNIDPVSLAFDAVESNNISALKWIKENVEKFYPTAISDDSNYSLLEYAVKCSRLNIVRWLHKNYEDVRNKIGETNLEGNNLLHIISSVEDCQLSEETHALVRWLISHDCKINEQNLKLETPLHIAVYNSFEISSILLANGADPNIKDYAGNLPISIPLQNIYDGLEYVKFTEDSDMFRYIKEVGLLLSYGSDMDVLQMGASDFLSKHIEDIISDVWIQELNDNHFIRACVNLLNHLSNLPQQLKFPQEQKENLSTNLQNLIPSIALDSIDHMSDREKLIYQGEIDVTKKILKLTKQLRKDDVELCAVVDTKVVEIDEINIDFEVAGLLQKHINKISDGSILANIRPLIILQNIISWLGVGDKYSFSLIAKGANDNSYGFTNHSIVAQEVQDVVPSNMSNSIPEPEKCSNIHVSFESLTLSSPKYGCDLVGDASEIIENYV